MLWHLYEIKKSFIGPQPNPVGREKLNYTFSKKPRE